MIESRKLPEDSGNFLRDQNAARFAKHPLEPAVRAIFLQNKDFSAQGIDLVACSSTVGSLLRFVRNVDKPFRFLVEKVGNTVFFVRRENSPRELIQDVRGYGHAFPEANTTWDHEVGSSTSHQRIISYTFDGLHCVIRFEADGYLPDKDVKDINRGKGPGVPSQEPLESLLEAVKIDTATTSAFQSKDKIEVSLAGRKVADNAIFDLKTRSVRREGLNILNEELPRYWVAQIPNLIYARHDNGVFEVPEISDIREDVDEWEADHQADLHRLSWLIRKIIAVAIEQSNGKVEVRHRDGQTLEIREQDGHANDVLSKEMREVWIASSVPS